MRLLLATCLLALLPAALPAQSDDWDDDWDGDAWAEDRGGLAWSGFAEAAGGLRFDRDEAVGRRTSLADLRLRVETDWQAAGLSLAVKGDLLYDGYEHRPAADFRELSVSGSPAGWLDFKAGRQVLTWGTGDLLFLNDLFPKDWVSFFAGREDEYLKYPQNALRLTSYNSLLNIDFVWTPVFTPDRYIRGRRFSFFSPAAGAIVAPDPPAGARRPSRQLGNGEFSLRLFRTLRGVEYAVYAHHGYFKGPSDFRDPSRPAFAPLSSIGASLRRPLFGGLWNLETAWYFSRDDRGGGNPALPNDQWRVLTGFEREWAKNFTVGLQYYLEWTQDHDQLLRNSPTPQYEPDEFRHLLTSRLTWRTLQDRLTWSLFAFVSPSDRDYYLRPAVSYRHSDHWTLAAGLNLFGGEAPHTFFAMFEDASNAYLRVRFNY